MMMTLLMLPLYIGRLAACLESARHYSRQAAHAYRFSRVSGAIIGGMFIQR